MPVPNTFANATATIPLSQLDANFATTITLGNTAIQLGNTVSTLNNMTLANVTVTSGNVTITNVTVTTANVTNATITTATIANASVSGNLAFTGTGNRITGDFSNGTFANRVMFQTSTANSAAQLGVLPSGTGTSSNFAAHNASDPTNASRARIQMSPTEASFVSDITGTGTYLPMTFLTFGSEKLRIAADATGTYTFGGTAPRITGDFSNATIANRVMFQTSTTNGSTLPVLIPNGTGTTSGFQAFNSTDTANAGWFGFYLDNSASYIAATKNGTGSYLPMTFYTGGSERMRIDTSGNVGIGTSSPIGKLSVYDSAAVSAIVVSDTSTNLSVQRSSDDAGQPFFLNRKSRGTFASPTAVNSADVIGQWVCQAYAGTNWRTVASIDMRADTYVSDTNISGSLRFYTTNASTASSERMRITPAGEVYIAGTTDQGAYNLQCNGTGVWGAGAYVNGSDARIKEDVAPIASGLDVVNKLNPVTYRYKESWTKDQSIQTGFIAQELLTALEDEVYVDGVVQQGGAEGYYSVAYQNIIPILTKAIQEQQQMIETLQAKVAALEGKK